MQQFSDCEVTIPAMEFLSECDEGLTKNGDRAKIPRQMFWERVEREGSHGTA